MSVKVTGVEQMMVEITKKVTGTADKQGAEALKRGGQLVYKRMQSGMAYFRDTGATLEEMQVSNVQTSRGQIKLYIYWKGPKDRYTLIHLNEKGYTRNGKFYSPRGRGAIARTIAGVESEYFNTVRQVMR